jgi:hypothetical protein
MHSFEISLGYESVDRTTFSTWKCNISMKNGSNVIIVKQLESRITLSLSLGTSKQKAKTV